MGAGNSPLVDPTMGSLFAIPQSDWTAINKMVGYVLRQEGEDPNAAPDFWRLYNSANDWIGSTFPGLQWQGSRVADCAKFAGFQFGSINTKLKALKPGQPLPAALQAQAQTAIRVTASLAGRLHSNAQSLVSEIQQMSAYATEVAGEIKAEGGYFEDLSPAFAGLGNAVTQVSLAGNALANDLAALAANEMTFDFLMSLDIPYALGAWAQLQTNSADFTSNIQDQYKYLSPPWH